MTRTDEVARLFSRVLDIAANVAPNALGWTLFNVDCWSRTVVEIGPTAASQLDDWEAEVEPAAREVLWVLARLMEAAEMELMLQALTPEEGALFRALIE